MSDGRVVRETRARSTGTLIQVIDNRDGSFDADDENDWFTFCVTHGNFCSHPSRKLATDWTAAPEVWCPDCQETYAAKGASVPECPGDPEACPLHPVP